MILEEEIPSGGNGNEDRRTLCDQRENWGSNGEKEVLGIFWRTGFKRRLELKIISGMRSSGLSSDHVSP